MHTIDFTNVKDGPSILEALKKATLIVEEEDLGGEFYLEFKNEKGELLDELSFFNSVVTVEDVSKQMGVLANGLLSSGIYSVLGEDMTNGTMVDLFYTLIEHDPGKYCQLGFRYLEGMDRDHDQETWQSMIFTLEKNMGKNEFLDELAKWGALQDEWNYREA